MIPELPPENGPDFPAPDAAPLRVFDGLAADPRFVDIASAALARCPAPRAATASGSSQGLWIELARIVAQLVLACTADATADGLARIRARPAGLYARFARKNLARRMPPSWGDDRAPLADALIAEGLEIADDRPRLDALFARP